MAALNASPATSIRQKRPRLGAASGSSTPNGMNTSTFPPG